MNKALCYLALGLILTGCTSAPRYSGAVLELPPCGAFPNCVNSVSGEGTHAIDPLAASALQWRALKDWIAEQKNWSVTSNQENFIQWVAVTPALRFRDDVQLLFMPELELIHVRSSSRLGISDLSANRGRIEVLRARLKDTR